MKEEGPRQKLAERDDQRGDLRTKRATEKESAELKDKTGIRTEPKQKKPQKCGRREGAEGENN